MRQKSNKRLLQEKYRDKFEVYLLVDSDDKPIYVGEGRAYHRADYWMSPANYKKFGFKPIIKFRVIVESRIESIELESKMIDKFKPIFNIADKGNKVIGRKLSDKHRENISKSGKGRIQSLETKNKISNSLSGHKVSDETRIKMSQSAKLKWNKV